MTQGSSQRSRVASPYFPSPTLQHSTCGVLTRRANEDRLWHTRNSKLKHNERMPRVRLDTPCANQVDEPQSQNNFDRRMDRARKLSGQGAETHDQVLASLCPERRVRMEKIAWATLGQRAMLRSTDEDGAIWLHQWLWMVGSAWQVVRHKDCYSESNAWARWAADRLALAGARSEPHSDSLASAVAPDDGSVSLMPAGVTLRC